MSVKIALVAPVEESVPPRKYGGIEQVVHLLDGQLSQFGHNVFLLASGGSNSFGQLLPLTDEPLSAGGRDFEADELVAYKEAAAERAAALLAVLRPDIVLNHSWRLLDYAGSITLPVLTTIHYPLDTGPYRRIFLKRPQGTYVSVSLSQQRAVESLPFAGNVYNGVDLEALPFSPLPNGYLAFLGRVSPDKGLDIAIRVAQDVCVPLKIAAKLDGSHRPWFDMVVAPLLKRGGAEFLGEVDAAGRAALLGGAIALLHPSRWSEPFGLAVVEAMACGTPVLALRRGAADELIVQGETGFVVDEEDDLVRAAGRVSKLERAVCRAHVEERFTHTQMAIGYEALAHRLVE